MKTGKKKNLSELKGVMKGTKIHDIDKEAEQAEIKDALKNLKKSQNQ